MTEIRQGHRPNKAALRVCQIVEALGKPGFGPKSLAEIAGTVRIPKTTVWRVLKELEAQQWVRYERGTDCWRLAANFVSFAVSFQRYMDDRQRDLDKEYAEMTRARAPNR